MCAKKRSIATSEKIIAQRMLSDIEYDLKAAIESLITLREYLEKGGSD